MAAVTPLRMPKWGLSMQEGKIVSWWKQEGAAIAEGDELVDIETSKITNVYEAPSGGTLRRIIAQEGETLPVGSLIAVVADAEVADAEVDAFITEFQANFTPGVDVEEGAGGLRLETVDAAGRAIALGRAGEGSDPPVVLLHGFAGDMNNWLFNIEALAANRPVIALDLPGHGSSSKDVGDGSLSLMSTIVKAALDAIGVGRIHLVGHSLGADIAARFAADNFAQVTSLTLICPASLPGNKISEEFLTGVIEASRARDLKPFVEMLFDDPSIVTKEMIEDMIRFKRIDGVEDALKRLRDRLVEEANAALLSSDLSKIPAATVIASRDDKIVGVPDESALPQAFKLIWIEGASHMPHLEKSADVNAILVRLTR
jgi:pyruvate dehydrogenase E2 component (dihydrolipoamide acetyltransferase)